MNAFSREISEKTGLSSKLWKNVMKSLETGRGPWCNTEKDVEIRWKLDKTENFSRMRLRKKINRHFDPHIGCALNYDKNLRETKGATVIAPPTVARRMSISLWTPFHSRKTSISIQKPQIGILPDISAARWMPGHSREDSTSSEGSLHEDTSEFFGSEELKLKNLVPDAPSHYGIPIFSSGCTLILPVKQFDGKINVYQDRIAFFQTRKPIDQDSPQGQESELAVYKDKTWNVDNIREIHYRRYNLNQSAIEIFFIDQTNIFLNFLSSTTKANACSAILSLHPPNLVYANTTTPADILKRSGLTEKWQQRQISNFDYLMQLNTIAGRTYNDLTQYPVFPWVICDYISEKLDLSDSKVYRDLSKPMGALNPDRLRSFLQRFESLPNDGTIPPFLYGTHYSSAETVMFYLIRMEPFTTYFAQIQGGKFELADRMFDSISRTWENCYTASSDLKELIPEFYYLPDFLVNENEFDLGRKQNGRLLDNVILPAWAQTPQDFIKKNREALESDFVSAHIDNWIDLIFGFKQRGEEAIKSNNLFYYLTYEGAVSLDSITDPNQKKSIEDQIKYFGQTPSQLLTKKHPKRFVPSPLLLPITETLDQLNAWNVQISSSPVVFIGTPSQNLMSSFLFLGDTEPLVTVSGDLKIGFHSWNPAVSVNSGSILESDEQGKDDAQASAPPFLFVSDPGIEKRPPLAPSLSPGLIPSPDLFSLSGDGCFIVTAGVWNNSILLSSTINSKQLYCAFRHKDVVTCVSLGLDGTTLATGSKDTTVVIWDVIRAAKKRTSEELTQKESPDSQDFLMTRHVLFGHEDQVTCLDTNVELDICVSGSMDGVVMTHTLKRGRYVQSFKPDGNSPISSLRISPSNGHIVVYKREGSCIFIYGLRSERLGCAAQVPDVSTLVISKDGKFLFTGSLNRTISVWSLPDLTMLHQYTVESGVCSLHLSNDERHLLAGLQQGALIILARPRLL
eukprot:TRINITY_DN5536_c0_g1_i1.p2 TRINITY_DN5536_c0_g1~~TRINITY_DN5536_c0_g1_i1.p2  ORF type:complete len:964 (+),score=216.54 TRINITY_DN5536_c0_g1_i1:3477-6368(+)